MTTALARGDADGARALAERLQGYAEGAGAAARLRALESGTWVGEAAEEARQRAALALARFDDAQAATSSTYWDRQPGSPAWTG